MKKLLLLSLLVSTATYTCEKDTLFAQDFLTYFNFLEQESEPEPQATQQEQASEFLCEQYVAILEKKTKNRKDKVFYTRKQAELIRKWARQERGRARDFGTLPEDLGGFDGKFYPQLMPHKGFKPRYSLERIAVQEIEHDVEVLIAEYVAIREAIRLILIEDAEESAPETFDKDFFEPRNCDISGRPLKSNNIVWPRL
jgi:hypothetical protein